MSVGLAKDLTAVGIPTEQAIRLGTDDAAAVTAAGTTIGTATAITSRLSVVTTASSQTGVKLPSTAELMQQYFGYVPSTTSGKLYPHASAATINGGTAGAAVTIAQGKSYMASRTSSTNWLVIVSA